MRLRLWEDVAAVEIAEGSERGSGDRPGLPRLEEEEEERESDARTRRSEGIEWVPSAESPVSFLSNSLPPLCSPGVSQGQAESRYRV